MISVLLVDDEPALLDILSLFFAKSGLFLVDTCPSGSQALSLIEKKQYDVIVSDYAMPGMDGISLLNTLKQQGMQIPFIIFTGKGSEQVAMDALNNGVTTYILKGEKPQSIFSELVHLCQRAVLQQRSERALKDSEEKYRTLVEHAPEGILIMDPQGIILLANNAAAKMVGSGNSALLTRRNVLEFIAPESRDGVLRDFTGAAKKGGEGIEAEYKAVTVAGTCFYVQGIGKAIRYEGRPAIFLSIREINLPEKDPSHNNEQAFRTLAEKAGYGVFILADDHFCYANPHFTTMTGYSPAELLHIAVWDLIHKDFLDILKEKVQGMQKAGKYTHENLEVTLIVKGGAECQVQLGMIPGKFDGKTAILGTALDITAQRSSESRLEQVNKKLQLLHEVTHHDLLNNFTALFGYFEIIKENTGNGKNLEFMKKQEPIFSAIREQILFTGYYQNLGNVKPQWQYVGNAIRDAAATLPLDGKVMNLEIGSTEILADPLLVRVFYNLMDNSLRHGGPVTEIRYRCEKIPEGLLIIYEDNGMGVPANNKERIFVKGMGKNSGLGLFLIKEILAITRITIRENGEPGKGARFEIFVPEGMFRYPVT
jgi:PAS domain S-box-containing protein